MAVGVIGFLVTMHEMGYIAFSGNGEMGWGSTSMQPGVDGTNTKRPTFYFYNDKIYQVKQEISKDEFATFIQNVKKGDVVNLYFVEHKLTNKFFESIKKELQRSKAIFSESKIEMKDIPK